MRQVRCESKKARAVGKAIPVRGTGSGGSKAIRPATKTVEAPYSKFLEYGADRRFSFLWLGRAHAAKDGQPSSPCFSRRLVNVVPVRGTGCGGSKAVGPATKTVETPYSKFLEYGADRRFSFLWLRRARVEKDAQPSSPCFPRRLVNVVPVRGTGSGGSKAVRPATKTVEAPYSQFEAIQRRVTLVLNVPHHRPFANLISSPQQVCLPFLRWVLPCSVPCSL